MDLFFPTQDQAKLGDFTTHTATDQGTSVMKLVDELGFASVVSLGCDALAECFSRTEKLNLHPGGPMKRIRDEAGGFMVPGA